MVLDFLFTVKGDTRGAILVQWNIHESTQGSAGMWDCHFRVGGATNSFLQLADCPPRNDGTTNHKCMAAALLLHLTPRSSGYFENVWAWFVNAYSRDSRKQAKVYTGPPTMILTIQSILVPRTQKQQ